MKYSEKIKLRTNDVDSLDHLKISTFLDYFQDLAGKQATLMGVGYDAMKEKNMAWVVLKTAFRIHDYPKPYSFVTAQTFPEPKGRVDFTRNYELFDDKNKVLVSAKSQWCIIDIERRGIVRTDKIVYPEGYCINETVLEGKLNKLQLLETSDLIPMKYIVGYGDLDHNGHMNNSKYADVMMVFLDTKDEVLFGEINYLHEVSKNDELLIFGKKEDRIYTVQVNHMDKVCAIGRFEVK